MGQKRQKSDKPPRDNPPASAGATNPAPSTDLPPGDGERSPAGAPALLRSRIVGEGDEAPDQLLANPLNWRVHPKHQADALEGVLEQVGWVQRVLVNKRTGNMVDGHLRVQIALRRNEPTIPVTYVDLTEDEERLILATLDPIAGLAGTDQELLDQVLAGLDAENDALAALLSDLRSDEANAAGQAQGAIGDDETPLPQEKAVSQRGDVWIMGRHRLICGDSEAPADIEALMGGQLADMVWTDPPYNVAYEDSRGRSIEGDKQADAAFRQFLRNALGSALAFTKPGGPIYVAHADSEGLNFRAATIEAGWELKQCLVWVKDSFTLGRQDHQWQHEPILYGWKPGAPHCWYGDRDKSTVLEQLDVGGLSAKQLRDLVNELRNLLATSVVRIDKPEKSELHPTMKPVALVKQQLLNSSRTGEIVLDVFGGSGTTLIACEALGRRARLCEKDPRYADVIVRRWEAWTRGQARRMSDGMTFLEAARAAAEA